MEQLMINCPFTNNLEHNFINACNSCETVSQASPRQGLVFSHEFYNNY